MARNHTHADGDTEGQPPRRAQPDGLRPDGRDESAVPPSWPAPGATARAAPALVAGPTASGRGFDPVRAANLL